MAKQSRFTKKGERLIRKLKSRNKKVPPKKRVNPFAVATARGFRRKKR